MASLAIVVSLLVAAPTRAEDASPSGLRKLPAQFYDLLIMRPLGLASLAAGAGFFALAGPLTAPFGDVGTAWELFVEEPFEFTFRRSLGNLDDF